MLISYNQSFQVISIYSPFWMVNKTGKMLTYRGSDEQRSDVERVDNTRQRASPFQEDLLLAAVHVDEDVSSAFGVGALYLLRE